ncbi:MAG: lipocalin-like domain-containing protein [Bacteroidota bacterium]
MKAPIDLQSLDNSNQANVFAKGILEYYKELGKDKSLGLKRYGIDLLKWILSISPDVTPQKAYIISFILGKYLYVESKPTDNIPNFTFPDDHKMQLGVAQGWYFLVSNLKVKSVKENGKTRPASGKIAVVTVMMRGWVMNPTTGRKVIKDIPVNVNRGLYVMEGIQALDGTFAVTFLVDEGVKERVLGTTQVDSKLLNPEVAFAQEGFSVKTSSRSYKGPKWDKNTSNDPLNSLFPLTMDFVDGKKDISFKLNCSQSDGQRQALYFREGYEGLYPIKDEDKDWHYYSIAQIPTQGEVSYQGKTYEVEGTSWFDHQWGGLYRQLPRFNWHLADKKFGGWAWFCFHFENGDAFTFAAVHKPTKLISFSAPKYSLEGFGKYIHQDGTTPTPLIGKVNFKADFKSPETGAKYPTSWQFDLQEGTYEKSNGTTHIVAREGGYQLQMEVKSIFDNQLAFFGNLLEFWEGGAVVKGQIDYADGSYKELQGEGFCESVGFERMDELLVRMGAFLLKGKEGTL